MNLQTIRNLADQTRQRLAALTAGSGDLDELARKRVVEREKLNLLTEQEAAERDRLEAKRIADLNKRRTAVLATARGHIDSALKQRNAAIEGFVAAIQNAARIAAEQPALFAPAALGLDAAMLTELFSENEQRQISDALSRSIPTISAGQVAAIVKAALSDKPERVQESVASLFGQSAYQPGVSRQYEIPARVRTVPVLDCVQGLEKVPYRPSVEAGPVATHSEPPPVNRQVCDLRPKPSGQPANCDDVASIIPDDSVKPFRQTVDRDAKPPRYEVG